MFRHRAGLVNAIRIRGQVEEIEGIDRTPRRRYWQALRSHSIADDVNGNTVVFCVVEYHRPAVVALRVRLSTTILKADLRGSTEARLEVVCGGAISREQVVQVRKLLVQKKRLE